MQGSIKEMAVDSGFSINSVQALLERFINHYKLIRYNAETEELAISNWGKYHLLKVGKRDIDRIYFELKEVEDLTLIQYIMESSPIQEFRSLVEAFCRQEEILFSKEN